MKTSILESKILNLRLIFLSSKENLKFSIKNEDKKQAGSLTSLSDT